MGTLAPTCPDTQFHDGLFTSYHAWELRLLFMYVFILATHSWLRWLLILLTLIVLFRVIPALIRKAPYSSYEQLLATLFFWMLNIQFILGLLLYLFFSPYTQTAFRDMSAAFNDPILRFFLIEHPLAVLLAIGAGHSNLAKVKRAVDDKQKHRYLMIGAGTCLFFMLIAIPWPFLPYGRMLFFL